MQLAMFHPNEKPMDRGWVGRIDGDRVIHLAAQTLQHFFTGGGGAREHAEYPRAEVTLLVPVLQPPSVRIFEEAETFSFGNPSAVLGPDAVVPQVSSHLSGHARLAAVIGAEGTIGGFSAMIEWRGGGRGAKANDFGLVLGPVVATDLDPDGLAFRLGGDGATSTEGRTGGFDWTAALSLAAAGTTLRTGDVIAGPAVRALDGIAAGGVTLEVDGIGTLDCSLAEPA
jgi:hypothetical protein